LDDRQLPEEGQVEPPVPVLAQSGPSLEDAPGWRRRAAPDAQQAAPVAVTHASHEWRLLEGYLFLALTLLGGSLLLAFVDDRWNAGYVTALRVPITFAALIVCGLAISRLRLAKEGLLRTAAPAVRDILTGLPDEQYFWLRLREEHMRMRRYGSPFAIAILDVDRLTPINQMYGELGGDAVIKHVAEVLRLSERASDVATRLGADQFGLVLLDCDRDSALAFVQRLNQYLANKPALLGRSGEEVSLPVTVSTGVAASMSQEMSPEEMMARARRSLDMAKGEREADRHQWNAWDAAL
jgi:diguanylate cyclase (GGDEF)-like protein